MQSWWQMWPGYFTEQECDDIIKIACQEEPSHTSRLDSITLSNSLHEGTSVRKLNRQKPDFAWLVSKLEYAFRRTNDLAFQFNLGCFHDIQFIEYLNERLGPQDWKEDISWASSELTQKKLILAVQLSASRDYTGGDIVLEHLENPGQAPQRTEMRKRGTVLVFPAFLKYKVIPVTYGTCHKLVTWYEGPHFR